MVTTREYGVREPLHPEIRALFDATLAAREANPRVLEAAVMRTQEPLLAAMFNAGAPEVAVEREIVVAGADGEMKALVHAAEGSGLPVVLYAHGGGYCVMSPQTHAKITKQLAVGVNAVVVSIDYRLAPEHPHPAGIEDCIAAFVWLRDHASGLGGDGSRIAMAGDSAGGGIVAAAAQRLVPMGFAPAAVLINCGWLDLNDDSPSFQAYGLDDPLIDEEVMSYWRQCYQPDRERWPDPDVSPLFGEIEGFPPACIVAAGIDPLCDDGLNFAARLREAGREVELLHYEGMPHVFSWFPGVSAGPGAVDAMCTFLRERLRA